MTRNALGTTRAALRLLATGLCCLTAVGCGGAETADVPGAVEAALTAPGNVRVLDSQGAGITLGWNAASADTARYAVWRGDANWSRWSQIASVSSLSYRDTNVSPGATYTYAVRSVDAAGYSSASSNAVMATAGSAPPVSASPFRTRVVSQPVLHSQSTALVQKLASNRPAITAEYGTAVHVASSTDPLCTVTFANAGAWGTPWTEQIRIPVGARATGSTSSDPWGDHWLTVRYNGAQYDLWYFNLWNGTACQKGTARATHGAKYAYPGDLLKPFPGGTGSGSGISVAAGTPTRAELQADAVDHALNLVVTFESGSFKAPAWKADGDCTSGTCVKAGQRFYLPVSDAEVNAIAHPGQRAIARALQRYGAYVTDRTADNNIPIEQGALSLFPWDYAELDQIPWAKMKALKCWDGSSACTE